MKPLLIVLSLAGLLLTVVPGLLVFLGRLTWAQHTSAMLVGTVLWFVCAPLVLKADRSSAP